MKCAGVAVGASLRPGSLRSFFDVPTVDVTDRHVALDLLWGREADSLRERLAAARSPLEALAELERILLRRLRRAPRLSASTARALTLARDADRPFRLDAFARDVGLSRKTIIARFRSGGKVSPHRTRNGANRPLRITVRT